MPIYEYKCGSGHRFELRQGFDAETTTVCPTCEATSRRVIHAASVHYKGSGFYTTDYGRSGSWNSDAKQETGGSKDGAGEGAKDTAKATTESSGSKTESKAEKKTASSDGGD
jgi:putative FmdB family regulatory protein